MEVTRKFAKYIVNMKFEKVPKEVLHQAKRSILDTIGVAIGGYGGDPGKILLDLIRGYGSKGKSTIIVAGDKVSCLDAAMVNATMSTENELDALHRFSNSHIAASVVHSTIALAEDEGIGGKEFITAVIVGYDVAARIGAAIDPCLRPRGIRTTPISCSIGSAAAAAKVLDLDEKRAVNTIGIVGCCPTVGLLEYWMYPERMMIMNLHSGIAARMGVLSALLARRGFNGPYKILEGKKGLLQAMAKQPYLGKLTQDLGESFEITKNSFKLWGGCGFLHPAITAAQELSRRYRIDVNDIQQVVINTFSEAIDCNKPVIKTVWEAKLSLQYATAISLLREEIEFVQEKVECKRVRALMKRVKVVVDPKLDMESPEKQSAKIEIKTKSGKKYIIKSDYAKGQPENPATCEELVMKFRRIASPFFENGEIKEIIKTISTLEEIDSIQRLTELLCFRRP